MKKLILLPLVLLISSCTLGSWDTNMTSTDSTSGSKYEIELKQASSKIKDSEEFKSCMDMNVPMCVQSAWMQLAQKEKSTEFCKELTTPDQQAACVFTITVVNAEEKWDKAACGVLTGDYLTQCEKSIIKSQAIKMKKPELCKDITTRQEGIDNSQDECMLSAIISNTEANPNTCTQIADESIRKMCTDMVTSRASLQTESVVTP